MAKEASLESDDCGVKKIETWKRLDDVSLCIIDEEVLWTSMNSVKETMSTI